MGPDSDIPRDASRIDHLVGERIRQRRILLGFTQDQLGEALGISYQQVQKYETGANRVSAGRLFQIACTLQTDVGSFFAGMASEDAGLDDRELASPRHVIELVRGFSRIEEDRLRMAVLTLVRALSEGGSEDEIAGLVMPAGAVEPKNGHFSGKA